MRTFPYIALALLTSAPALAADLGRRSGDHWIIEDERIEARIHINFGGQLDYLRNKRTGFQYLAGNGYYFLGNVSGGEDSFHGNIYQSFDPNPAQRVIRNEADYFEIEVAGEMQTPAHEKAGIRFFRNYAYQRGSSRLRVTHRMHFDGDFDVFMLSATLDVHAAQGNVRHFAWDPTTWWEGCCDQWRRHSGGGLKSGGIENPTGLPNYGRMVVTSRAGLNGNWADIYDGTASRNGGVARVFDDPRQFADVTFFANTGPAINFSRTLEAHFINADARHVEGHGYTPQRVHRGQVMEAREWLYVHDGDYNDFFAMLRGAEPEPPPQTPAGSDDAQLVAVTLPANAAPGQTVSASVVLRNSGGSTWVERGGPAAGLRLGALSDNGLTWKPGRSGGFSEGPGNQRIFLDDTVPPGAEARFDFSVQLPTRPGDYVFAARMVHDGVAWFGPEARQVIRVGEAPPLNPAAPDAAELIAAELPRSAEPDSLHTVHVRLRNIGSQPWEELGRDAGGVRLASTGDNRIDWKIPDGAGYAQGQTDQRVFLRGAVPPGEMATFELQIRLPDRSGDHRFSARLVREGVAWFGPEVNANVVVGDVAPPPAGDGATVLDLHLPASGAPGAVVNAAVRVRNDSEKVWHEPASHEGGIRLGATSANAIEWIPVRGGYSHGVDNQRAFVPQDIAPGAEVTFELKLRLPQTPGNHRFAAQMVHDGVGWFGPQVTGSIAVATPRRRFEPIESSDDEPLRELETPPLGTDEAQGGCAQTAPTSAALWLLLLAGLYSRIRVRKLGR